MEHRPANATPLTEICTDCEDTEPCRYCMEPCSLQGDVSSCTCSSRLCGECLKKELQLTMKRNKKVMECTICKMPYQIHTAISTKRSVRFFFRACFSQLLCTQDAHNLTGFGLFRALPRAQQFFFVMLTLGVIGWVCIATMYTTYPELDSHTAGKGVLLCIALLDGFIALFSVLLLAKTPLGDGTTLCGFQSLYLTRLVYLSVTVSLPWNGEPVPWTDIVSWMLWTTSAAVEVFCLVYFLRGVISTWKLHRIRSSRLIVKGTRGPFTIQDVSRVSNQA